MATIPYLKKGVKLSHIDLNSLYTEANRRLKKAYNSLSPALWAGGSDVNFGTFHVSMPERLFSRRFYFFDSVPSTPYTTVAEAYIGQLATALGTVSPPSVWFRKYDHTVFTTYVTGATVATDGGSPAVDLTRPAVRLVPPASAAVQQALIWPLNGPAGAGYPNGLLDWSLEAHKKIVTISMVNHNCYCYVNDLVGGGGNLCDDSEVNHIHIDDPIEVFLGRGVGASFNWLSNYNKYSFIRFNNLQNLAVTITGYTIDGAVDPGLNATIPALGSLCIRRSPGINGWFVCLDYFFLYSESDPWFLANPGEPWSNSTNALLAGMELPHIGDDLQTIANPDPSKWWDYGQSGLASMWGDPKNSATLLGDLVFHKGKLLKVFYNSGAGTVTKTWLNFTGMSGLTALLASAGITLTNPSPNDPFGKGFEITSTLTDFDLMDYSTNILHIGGWGVISGGQTGVLTVGTGIAAFVWSTLGIPNGLLCLQITTTARSATGANTVNWTNKYFTQNSGGANTLSSYFDSLATGFAALLALRPNNDVPTTLAAKMTTHGPWLTSTETIGQIWPASNFDWTTAFAPFPSAVGPYAAAPDGRTGQVVITLSQAGGIWGLQRVSSWWLIRPFNAPTGQLTEQRWAAYGGMKFTGSGWGNYKNEWLAPLWPRVDRPWISLRFFLFSGGEVFSTNGSSSSQTKVPPASEFPFLKSYYELSPFCDWHSPLKRLNHFAGQDLPAPFQFQKKGVRFLDYFVADYDFYGSLSAWLNGKKMRFQEYNGTPGGAYTFRVSDLSFGSVGSTNYYPTQQGQIQHAAPTTYDGGQNLWPMMVEHYNTIASAVNGVTQARGGKYVPPVLTNVSALAMPVYQTTGVGPLNLRPRTAYACWDATVWTGLATSWTNFGVTVYTSAAFPADWSGTNTIQNYYVYDSVSNTWTTSTDPTGSGSTHSLYDNWLSPSATCTPANFRFVKIADVQARCTALGLPFRWTNLAVPCKLSVVDAGHTDFGSGGASSGWIAANGIWPVVDGSGAGQWVIDPDADGGNNTQTIRASTSRCDFWIDVLGGTGQISRNWAPLDERFYASIGNLNGTYSGPSCTPNRYAGSSLTLKTQFLIGNRAYVYRNYGCPAANAVTWGRNFADVQPRNQGSPVGGYVLSAVTTIDNAQEVTGCASDSETVIVTAITNAIMQIWPGLMSLT